MWLGKLEATTQMEENSHNIFFSFVGWAVGPCWCVCGDQRTVSDSQFFPFHHVSRGEQTQVIWLGSEGLTMNLSKTL